MPLHEISLSHTTMVITEYRHRHSHVNTKTTLFHLQNQKARSNYRARAKRLF